MPNNIPIKEWAVDDRPREKLISKGVQTLSNSELLAIIIGSGTQKLTALDLARNIFKNSKNSIDELGRYNVDYLIKNFKGIGFAKAVGIVAALEIGRRRKNTVGSKENKIICSKDIFNTFKPILQDLVHEEVWMGYLDTSNKIISIEKISQGGLSASVIDIRILFKKAIDKLSSCIIICHNHPSGNIQPSNNDRIVTRKIQDAGKILDVELLDHLIITQKTYYSFADEGELL